MTTRNRRGSRILVLLGASALLLTILALFAHPFFAITNRSGGDALVVEGWLHEEGMEEAAKLFVAGNYQRVITTGTTRPFAYYLQHGDTLILESEHPIAGDIVLSMAGLPEAKLLVEVELGTWRRLNVEQGVVDHHLQGSGQQRLRLVAESENPPPSGEAVVFIAGLHVNGKNAHAPSIHGGIKHAVGREDPLTPTFAHQARLKLIADGIPESKITAVPTWSVLFSRTLSTAIDVTVYMEAHGIHRFDVATLAVHARRTNRMYSIARAQRPGNGIVALYDPWCARWTWWGNYYGWFQMLKELAALPLPWLAE